MNQPAVEFDDVTCSFVSDDNKHYTAVRDVNLTIGDGEFVSVVGPTGCGKSTVLNMAAGLLTPSKGTVKVFGEELVGLNKRAGYMFQAEALMPWRTAIDNVSAGLQFKGVPEKERHEQARHWLSRVGLSGFEDRYPHELSGGMRKRVALAQTLIMDPDIILMDEPFSALDIQTRQLMENEVLALWSQKKKAVLFITHDLDELFRFPTAWWFSPPARVLIRSVSSISTSLVRVTWPKSVSHRASLNCTTPFGPTFAKRCSRAMRTREIG